MNQSILKIISSTGSVKTIEFMPPKRLSSLLSEFGIPVEMPCGGRQKCLKCKIRVTGKLSVMKDYEKSLLTEEERADNIRFACMTEATGDVRIELLSTNNTESDNEYIETQGKLPSFTLDPWGHEYGIAVDIGTTTIAAYFYNLTDGKLIDTMSCRNPQAVFGADVISRLEKSMNGQRDALSHCIRSCLSGLITDACRRNNISTDKIGSIVLTGNTAMLYLLCGRDPASIAAAPFEPDCSFGMYVPADELDLPCSAKVYLPRCLSAYVGADINNSILASGFFRNDRVTEGKPRIMADIGTNGEMALAANGTLWCCSTAAGPAFEGAGINQGMPAKTGAVHSVKFDSGKIEAFVLGGVKAEGICGSGLVDAVAAMCLAGVLDETGMIKEEGHSFTDYITEKDGQIAFRLPETEVILTQKDIRAVQLAKSAICAGMLTLIEEAGFKPEDIHELAIAGGFGSHIDVYSAETIGLIPSGFSRRAYSIGNAAGAGASMILLSETVRAESEGMDKFARIVELTTSRRFMDLYIEGMMFPV